MANTAPRSGRIVADVLINRVSRSRLPEVDQENLEFGEVFSDHMLIADCEAGEWGRPRILPYGAMEFSPALSALHYGQSVFEGFKVHRTVDGGIAVFRPWKNHARLNRSAQRLAMPGVPASVFIEGMAELVRLDRDWIPAGEEKSLYVRPVYFATDESIFVKPARRYRLAIMTCPTRRYFHEPIRLVAEEKFVRAFPSGTGDAKASGNYAAALLAGCLAQQRGFHNVLWLDGVHHRLVEECGVMNIFFVIGSVAVTPALNGSILPGVTRDSVLTLLNDLGIDAKPLVISMEDVLKAHRAGQLREAFGVGTAVSVAPIASILYRGCDINLPKGAISIAERVRTRLLAIQTGREPDIHNWLMRL